MSARPDLALVPAPPPESPYLTAAMDAARIAYEQPGVLERLWADPADAECGGCGHMVSSHLGGVPGGECLRRGCLCEGFDMEEGAA